MTEMATSNAIGDTPSSTLRRFEGNPILTAEAFPFPANSAFNPAAVEYDGTTLLLVRVEDRRGLSLLHVARSPNGFTDWKVDPSPAFRPIPGDHSAEWGFEDPRAVWVPELSQYVITCTAYGPGGPAVHLSLTDDFNTFEHYGVVIPPDDKNAALFPRRIGGTWAMLHRPMTTSHTTADIWISRSNDLLSWRTPEHVMACRTGAWWDSARIGTGPPPIETDEGWLLIYHGVKQMVGGPIYRVGLALLDIDEPNKVLRRCNDWIFGPEADYERSGDVNNVVFPCGAIVDPNGNVRVYYGSADTTVSVATTSVHELLTALG